MEEELVWKEYYNLFREKVKQLFEEYKELPEHFEIPEFTKEEEKIINTACKSDKQFHNKLSAFYDTLAEVITELLNKRRVKSQIFAYIGFVHSYIERILLRFGADVYKIYKTMTDIFEIYDIISSRFELQR